MKKQLLYFIFLLICLSPVFAASKENRLYFTGSGNRLYYNSALYDEDVFMKHTDMVPGSSYEDELIISNNTRTDYNLYLKVVLKEQSDLALELLKNIEMTIYLDGKLLYDGYADGLDYNGIDLQNAIFIGEYKTDKVSHLTVKTTLSTKYDNTENDETSYIDWQFIANYEDEVIPINPDTGDKVGKYLKYGIYAFLIIMILLILLKFYYKNV